MTPDRYLVSDGVTTIGGLDGSLDGAMLAIVLANQERAVGGGMEVGHPEFATIVLGNQERVSSRRLAAQSVAIMVAGMTMMVGVGLEHLNHLLATIV